MPTLAHDWPDRDFSPEARDYLVVEVRQRIQEQLARISAQDIKTATIFTISVLLISASGLIGDTRLFASLSGSLLGLALVASLSTWVFAWLSYRAREIVTGEDVPTLAAHYPNSSVDELKSVVLATLTLGFEKNAAVIRAKEKWLRYAVNSVGCQVLLLFAVLVSRSI